MTNEDLDETTRVAFELGSQIDQVLIGKPMPAVELAVAIITAKMALARQGDAHENLDALFERVDGILTRWEEEQEAKALLNMPTKGPMQ